MSRAKATRPRILRAAGNEATGRFVSVTLSLYASLGRFAPGPGQPMAVEVEEGLTLGELLQAFRVPLEEVKLVFVNHRATVLERVLAEGDRVGAFPPVAGG